MSDSVGPVGTVVKRSADGPPPSAKREHTGGPIVYSTSILDLPLDIVEYLLQRFDLITLAVLGLIPVLRFRWSRVALLHMPRFLDSHDIRPWYFGRLAPFLLLRVFKTGPTKARTVNLWLFYKVGRQTESVASVLENRRIVLRAVRNIVYGELFGSATPTPQWSAAAALFVEHNAKIRLPNNGNVRIRLALTESPKTWRPGFVLPTEIIFCSHQLEMSEWLRDVVKCMSAMTHGGGDDSISPMAHDCLPRVVLYLESLFKDQYANLQHPVRVLPSNIEIWVEERTKNDIVAVIGDTYRRRATDCSHPDQISFSRDDIIQSSPYPGTPSAYLTERIRRFARVYANTHWYYEVTFAFHAIVDRPMDHGICGTIPLDEYLPFSYAGQGMFSEPRFRFIHGVDQPKNDFCAYLSSTQFCPGGETDADDVLNEVYKTEQSNTVEEWANLT